MAGLRKNSETGIILGVCSGISEWTKGKVPVHLVRVITLVGLFVSFSIVGWVYIGLAGILSDTAECSMLQKRIKIAKIWNEPCFTLVEMLAIVIPAVTILVIYLKK